MNIIWDEINVSTDKRLKIIDITQDVREIVENGKVREGTVTIFNPHVTCAVCINEHDPELWEDLLEAYQKLAPLRGNYRHNAKYSSIPGEQNTHAHILNTLIGHSVNLPVKDGRLVLGTWQSVLFVELDGGRRRKLTVQVTGK
jgi:secondary thiamine-phosphate synthase enzyme